MGPTLASLKSIGIDRQPDTLTRKDLADLTKAGEEWTLDPNEIPAGDKVSFQKAITKVGRHKPIDLQNDTDFTDTAANADDAQTHVDNFSRTDIVSRVADELVLKLSNADYRSMSEDELKAALADELKNYLK
tara:strand:+ start:77 stop:472 length:396 start_codon:yes stop_codon:yes gene_type:complete